MVAFLALNLVSCSDDDDSLQPGTEDLYFGNYYGQCGGNCTTVYWLRDGTLSEDTINSLYSSDLLLGDPAAFTLLPDSLYELAADLPTLFPAELFDQPETIGIPDAYDQGGYFIAVPEGTGYRSWRIDTKLADVPEELRPFLEGVTATMIAIRN